MTPRFPSRARSGTEWLSSTLAGLMLVLTLGVGIAEAWHAEEHEDEGHCVECALCVVSTLGPVSKALESPAPTMRVSLRGPAGLDDSAAIVTTPRRPDAARAPPA